MSLKDVLIKDSHIFFLDPCNTVECSFYSTCVLTSADTATCRCTSPSSVNTPSLRDRYTLCGSDGRLYVNKEEMEYESCRQQKEITVQEFKNCGKYSLFLVNNSCV